MWTASSDAARNAYGEAAARWGNAQAVTFYRPGQSQSQGRGMRWKLKVMGGGGGTEEKGPGGGSERPRRHARLPAETRCSDGGPSCMARDRCPGGLRRRCGLSRRRRRIKRYGQGPGRGGLRRDLRVGAAAEENQAARRASGGAREERNGGAGGVEGRQPGRYWRSRACSRGATMSECTSAA
jgi:hypothetical protein